MRLPGVGSAESREVTFILCQRCVPVTAFVSLMGSFNGWDPAAHRLVCDPDGRWRITLRLPPGDHRYLFIVDGTPVNTPAAGDRMEYPCEWGTPVSVRTVD